MPELAPTDWISGLLSGFTTRKAEIEAQNLAESARARDQEARLYQTLINSPDPEIQAAAVTGLLESARPGRRKGGFAGWLGQMEANPAYAQVQRLLATPVEAQETTYAPTIGTPQATIPQVPSGSLSLPETSPTEIGAPPPTPVVPGQYPGTPFVERAAPPLQATTRTVRKPRRAYPTTYDLASQQAAGQYGGRIEGILTALKNQGVDVTPELAQQIALELSGYSSGGVGSSPFQSVQGELINADGSTTPAFGVFDRATGGYVDPITHQPLTNFRPKPTGAGYRFGVTREAIAKSMFGKDFSQLDQAQAAAVLQEEQTVARQMASSRALGTEQGQYVAPIDLPTAQRTGARVGTSAAQYADQRVGTAQQQTRRITAGDIRQQLDHIKTLLTPLPSATELAGLAPGAAVAVRRRQPSYRNQFAQLESAINNIRASLTRTMQANVGTETERDAERALSTIADFEGRLLDPLRGDTRESATQRLDETIRYLDQILQSIPGVPQPTGPPVGVPPPGPAAGGGPPPAAAAPAVRPTSPAAGPVGYTVDDQGRLLFNGQPVQ